MRKILKLRRKKKSDNLEINKRKKESQYVVEI